MRKSLVLAMVAVLVCSSMALAGVPDPARSGTATLGQGTAQHYRFGLAGDWDVLTCAVTLRDAFDTPVASCSTSASASFSAGGSNFPFGCFCTGSAGGAATQRLTGNTTAGGVVNFLFANVGGNGQLDLAVTAHCVGNIAIATHSVQFTSPDMNGTCPQGSGNGGDISDLGVWGQALATYNIYSDYNLDTLTDVSDLGQWGFYGITKPCP
jgi:hypothetical protein